MKIEGIPGPGAKIYSNIVSISPVMKDFYRGVVDEVLSKVPAGRILDIGTGPGYVPIMMAKKSNNLEIKGIDISQAMVNIAAKNARKAGLSERLEFKPGSAGSVPFGDGYFDLVITTLSFHHWSKPVESLKEIRRVLTSGGEVWIYELQRDMTPEAKRQLRARYGWFLYLVIMYLVRLHSSMSVQEIRQLLSKLAAVFPQNRIEDRGHVIKVSLMKPKG